MNLLLTDKVRAFVKRFGIFIFLMLMGSNAMSADIELKWEWPANRSTDNKLLVKIDSIKKQKTGFFNSLKSPSLINNLPDPRVISGNIINSKDIIASKNFALTLPLLEMESIESGSYAVLGIINKTTCICIVSVENKNVDLSSIDCVSEN